MCIRCVAHILIAGDPQIIVRHLKHLVFKAFLDLSIREYMQCAMLKFYLVMVVPVFLFQSFHVSLASVSLWLSSIFAHPAVNEHGESITTE
ncbi:hypothetical protein [Ammoniphilus sp. YIM 78166]|uniref:hypothetical protein n=1 Tax=Ammoniphilus sp. YIM 78166 TaxID=1644106 RepID=UPI001F10FF51|nr:hypothetical protein [Ammoniphilus sp. YIM 78166]